MRLFAISLDVLYSSKMYLSAKYFRLNFFLLLCYLCLPGLISFYKQAKSMSTDLGLAPSLQLVSTLVELQGNDLTLVRKNSDNSTDKSFDRQSNQSETTLKKYKTELCKNYSEKEQCPYNSKCQFAHGQAQLLANCRDTNKHFKTRKCKSYWSQGYCSYGMRCHFSHQAITKGQNCQYLQIWSKVLTPQSNGEASRLLALINQVSKVLHEK